MGGVPTWKRRVLGIAGSWLIAGGLAHWIGAGAHELSNGTPSTAEHRIYLMMMGWFRWWRAGRIGRRAGLWSTAIHRGDRWRRWPAR